MMSNGAAHAVQHGHVYGRYAPPKWPEAHCSSKKQYDEMYAESLAAPEKFWGRIAEQFYWKKKWEAPFHRWALLLAYTYTFPAMRVGRVDCWPVAVQLLAHGDWSARRQQQG